MNNSTLILYIFRSCADFFIILTHFGVMCIYYIYGTIMIKELIDLTGSGWDFNWIALFIMPLFLLIIWLRTLKILGPFVIVSNIFTLTSIILILICIFHEIDFTKHSPYMYKKYDQIPAFFGIYLFSLESSGVVSN